MYCLSKILQRQLQAGFEIHFGLPAEQPPGLRDIRASLLGIVLRQRLELNLARRTAHRNDFFGALQDREFSRIPDVHGLVFRRPRQANDAIDLVADVAKTARLAAIAVNRQIFPPQRLPHEVGNHAPVVDLHARPIGVKDAQNARIHLVVAVIGHGYGLGETFGFVIHGARPDRVDMSPITLCLRMLQRIAITFGRRSHHELGSVSPGQVKGFKCAVGSYAQRLDSVGSIVHRAGRTGEVKDVVHHAALNRGANVLLEKFEAGVVPQMFQVGEPSREEIVGRNHRVTVSQQSITEMRTEKARSPGDQRACRFHQFRSAPSYGAGLRRPHLQSMRPDGPRCNKRNHAPT